MSLHDAELQHIEAVLKETKGVIEGPQGAATIPETQSEHTAKPYQEAQTRP